MPLRAKTFSGTLSVEKILLENFINCGHQGYLKLYGFVVHPRSFPEHINLMLNYIINAPDPGIPRPV